MVLKAKDRKALNSIGVKVLQVVNVLKGIRWSLCTKEKIQQLDGGANLERAFCWCLGFCSTLMCCSVVLVHGSTQCQVLYWQTTPHIEAPVPLPENFKISVADDVGAANFGESGLHCWNSLPTEQVTAPCTEMPSNPSAPVHLLPLGLCCLGPMFIRSF